MRHEDQAGAKKSSSKSIYPDFITTQSSSISHTAAILMQCKKHKPKSILRNTSTQSLNVGHYLTDNKKIDQQEDNNNNSDNQTTTNSSDMNHSDHQSINFNYHNNYQKKSITRKQSQSWREINTAESARPTGEVLNETRGKISVLVNVNTRIFLKNLLETYSFFSYKYRSISQHTFQYSKDYLV